MSILAIAGMVLLLEGALPFVAPAMWRETMVRIAKMQDGQIRFIGLGGIVVGGLLVAFG
ncbi:MAG: DUF2065 domain-containing protein [Betaproteobacteria bacterium]|jgi:uncharacterized protein YjeT (DUF2065 family)|nr:DUF2065 domain-containing protein [Betaproteobacteria bacterium]